MLLRLLVVAILFLAVGGLTVAYRRARAAHQGTAAPGQAPPLPPELVSGADRTWVIFTTPYCATCGPVEDQLRAADPEARLVKVDASRDPQLADAYRVRTAPTTLLADEGGTVRARLVGAAAVSRYLAGDFD